MGSNFCTFYLLCLAMSEGLAMRLMLLLISVCGVYCNQTENNTPVVHIKGHEMKGLNENGYAKFLGIPYAVIDRNNTLGPSKPHPGFIDVFEANESKKCPQVENNVVVGTLDCLTLDIYVPNITKSQNRLPVMAWIRGGYPVVRTGPDDGTPEDLVAHEVIVVTINYRLDFYGFICLDIPEAPGNQGLKDQVLALRWINDNIEAFHGNPKEITVFGAGLAGTFVNLHLFSSYEKLFQRAIIQSGSAFTPLWAGKPNKTQAVLDLAGELAFETKDIRKAVKHLSSIDFHKVLEKENIINAIGTKPCVEKVFQGIESFITEHPSNIISSKARTTPVIIGCNDNEAAVWVNLVKDEYISNYTFGSVLKGETLNNVTDAEDTVRHFYIGDEKISVGVKGALTNFVYDFFYSWPIQRMADHLLKNDSSIVYRYIFSYSGRRNLQKIRYDLNSTGATHGDELGYLLNYTMLTGTTTPNDQLMIDRMITIWTNFAKFGKPIPEKTALLPTEWNPITKKNHSYLDINLKLSLRAMTTYKRIAFWDLFYKIYANNR